MIPTEEKPTKFAQCSYCGGSGGLMLPSNPPQWQKCSKCQPEITATNETANFKKEGEVQISDGVSPNSMAHPGWLKYSDALYELQKELEWIEESDKVLYYRENLQQFSAAEFFSKILKDLEIKAANLVKILGEEECK